MLSCYLMSCPKSVDSLTGSTTVKKSFTVHTYFKMSVYPSTRRLEVNNITHYLDILKSQGTRSFIRYNNKILIRKIQVSFFIYFNPIKNYNSHYLQLLELNS